MLTFFPYDEALVAVRNTCGQKNTALTKILQFLTGSAGYCRLTIDRYNGQNIVVTK